MNSDDSNEKVLTDKNVSTTNTRAGKFYVKNVKSFSTTPERSPIKPRPTNFGIKSKPNINVSYVSGNVNKPVNPIRRPSVPVNHLSPILPVSRKLSLYPKQLNKQYVPSVKHSSMIDKFDVHDCVLLFDECFQLPVTSVKYVPKFANKVNLKGSTFKWVPKGSIIN